MNVFGQFLIFPLRKFEAFRNYVYYSLVDRDINFFNPSIGNQELIITGLKPYVTDSSKAGGLIFPVTLNRDYLAVQMVNHGRPEIEDTLNNNTYSLSVLTFLRAHSANTISSIVSATFVNNKGLLQYVGANTPRFEYGDTRQNLLSSSTFIPETPLYFYSSINESGIILNRLVQQSISGTCLKNDTSQLPYTRLLYGWDGYFNGLHGLTVTTDIPEKLIGNTSQYFLLSSCKGGANGDSFSYSRNSPLCMVLTTGSSAIPLIQYKEIAFTATQIDDQWKRYSITTPVALWGWRRGAPQEGYSPANNSLWDKWTTFENGTRPGLTRGSIPAVRLSMLHNPVGGLGAYAFWGPQLEYGENATPYEYNEFAVVSGATNTKNMAPPLSSSVLNNTITWWRYANTRRVCLTSDTPFGPNNIDPSYILEGTNQEWGAGFFADIPLRLPDPINVPGANLLRNTDFSGAEVGDVIRRGADGTISEWFGDYSGRAPYWQDLWVDNLRGTTVRIISTGKIDGNNFVDYRCTRVTTDRNTSQFNGTISFHPDWWQYVKANDGDTMTASISCALINGVLPGPVNSPNDGQLVIALTYQGLNRQTAIHDNPLNSTTNNFPSMGGSVSRIITASSLTDMLTGISITGTANDPRISRVNFEFRTNTIPAASTFDFVVRLCGPKLEKNTEPTPYVPTATQLHTLTTMTFSCYIKYISGGRPVWEAPGAAGTQGGIIQRTSFVDPTRIRTNTTITNSMYVKIDGPSILDAAKLLFQMGITDGKMKDFYATKSWQRVQYTGLYNRSDSSFAGRSDGRGFQFVVDRNNPDNIGFDPNTTRFYFTGLQTELGASATDYIPTAQAKINTANTMTGLLMEPERANIALYSTDFTRISARNLNITQVNGGTTAPDNSTLTSFISTRNSNAVLYLTGCNVGKINTRHTISFFIKAINTDTEFTFNQHPQHEGSNITFSFDPSTNRLIRLSPSNSEIYGVERFVDNWYRIYYTTFCTANSGKLWPGFSVSNGTRQFYLWGLQIEEGDFPTSYIPVSNFIGVRRSDILTLSGENLGTVLNKDLIIANVTPNSATLYVESKRKYNSSSQQSLVQFRDRNNSLFNVIAFGSNTTTLSSGLYNVNLALTIPSTWEGTILKSAFAYNNVTDNICLASNGQAVSATITQNLLLSAFTFAPNYIGHIRKIFVFPDSINLNDLKTITT